MARKSTTQQNAPAPEQNEPAPTPFDGVDFAAALNAVAPAPVAEKLFRLDLSASAAYASEQTIITREKVGTAVRWFQKARVHAIEMDPQGRVDASTGHPSVAAIVLTHNEAKSHKVLPFIVAIDA